MGNFCLYLFSPLKIFRSWYGGVWEKWCMEGKGSRMWFNTKETTKERGFRPHGFCRGTPTVEDYRNKVVI